MASSNHLNRQLTSAEKQRLARRRKEYDMRGLHWKENPDIIKILKAIRREHIKAKKEVT